MHFTLSRKFNEEEERIIENKKITVFHNAEFGDIRTTLINDEPWFVGKDVASVFGYHNTSKALLDHVDDDDKLNNESLSSLGQRGGWLINESGLYSLILSSKLPSAKKFKRWVTSEVLPAIRRTGGYINNADLMVSTYFFDVSDEQKFLIKNLLTNIENLQKKIVSLNDENDSLNDEIVSLNDENDSLNDEIVSLNDENDLLAQKNLEWADRPLINSLIRAYAVTIGNNFGKAWNDYKKDLLYKHGINLNARITNYLNAKNTKPRMLSLLHDSELPNAVSTAVSLCRDNKVDVDHLLRRKANLKT